MATEFDQFILEEDDEFWVDPLKSESGFKREGKLVKNSKKQTIGVELTAQNGASKYIDFNRNGVGWISCRPGEATANVCLRSLSLRQTCPYAPKFNHLLLTDTNSDVMEPGFYLQHVHQFFKGSAPMSFGGAIILGSTQLRQSGVEAVIISSRLDKASFFFSAKNIAYLKKEVFSNRVVLVDRHNIEHVFSLSEINGMQKLYGSSLDAIPLPDSH